jgi:hypothetical protein
MKSIMIGTLLLVVTITLHGQESSAPGSISGRVVPEYTRLGVGLAHYAYDDSGELILVNSATTRTSTEIGKFGEFTFDNVEPGEYYLYANPFGLAAPKGEVLPLTFHPGVQDLAGATKIVLAPGEKLRVPDLNLFSTPASAIRIHLIDATGNPDLKKACVAINWRLRGLGSDLTSGMNVCGPKELTTVTMAPMGPGTYDLHAGWQPRGSPDTPQGAAASIDVRNIDLDVDIVVSLVRVSGRIQIEESDGSLRPAAGLQVRLIPKRIGQAEQADIAPDGSFRLENVGRNDYVVEFTRLPPDAYVARLTEDSHDLLQEGLEVRSANLEIDGVVSLAGGSLAGTITTSGTERAVGAVVALVPDLPGRTSYLYRATTTNANGEFSIPAIAPGSYHLFAWPKLNGAAYKNADFMKAYEGRGTEVVIQRNARSTAHATLLEN